MQPNSLAFIALCNEFCSTLEGVAAGSDRAPSSRAELVASMLNYIPRLYISATDLKEEASADDSHDGHCGCGHDHCCDDEADDCCHCDDCSDSDELYTIADDHEGWGIESVLSTARCTMTEERRLICSGGPFSSPGLTVNTLLR